MEIEDLFDNGEGQGDPDGGEGQGDPDGREGQGDPDGGEGQGDPDGGEGQGDPDPTPKPISRAQQEIIKLRERTQRAEDEARKAREEIAAFKVQPSDEQRLFEKEEATLKAVAPDSWEAYNIGVARNNRANQRAIADLKLQNDDREDKYGFDQLKLEKPKIYEAYKDKVEAKLKEIRATGQNVSRIMLCDLMLGEDMRTGKFKTKSALPVKRGETPKARSDVSRSGGKLSPADALAKRLEGIPI